MYIGIWGRNSVCTLRSPRECFRPAVEGEIKSQEPLLSAHSWRGVAMRRFPSAAVVSPKRCCVLKSAWCLVTSLHSFVERKLRHE